MDRHEKGLWAGLRVLDVECPVDDIFVPVAADPTTDRSAIKCNVFAGHGQCRQLQYAGNLVELTGVTMMIRTLALLFLLAACAAPVAELPEDFDASFTF